MANEFFIFSAVIISLLAIFGTYVLVLLFIDILNDKAQRWQVVVDWLTRKKQLTLGNIGDNCDKAIDEVYSAVTFGAPDLAGSCIRFAMKIGALPADHEGPLPFHLMFVIEKKAMWEAKRRSGGLEFNLVRRVPKLTSKQLFRLMDEVEAAKFQKFCEGIQLEASPLPKAEEFAV